MLFIEEDKTFHFIKIFVPDYRLWTTETYEIVDPHDKVGLLSCPPCIQSLSLVVLLSLGKQEAQLFAGIWQTVVPIADDLCKCCGAFI